MQTFYTVKSQDTSLIARVTLQHIYARIDPSLMKIMTRHGAVNDVELVVQKLITILPHTHPN